MGIDRIGGGALNYNSAQVPMDQPVRDIEKSGKVSPVTDIPECQTCASRRYQDGSNDPGVSFKSPTKMSPSQAAGAVISHEREHYSRESSDAEENDREVVSNDIQIFTSVCPECGKTYVSGGETTTVTRAKQEKAEFAKQFFDSILGGSRAGEIDKKK